MKTKRINLLLEDIHTIANFQQNRLKDKKAVNKELVLRQALNFITADCIKIIECLK